MTKKFLLALVAVVISTSFIFAQTGAAGSTEQSPTPTSKIHQVAGPRTMWDVELSFDVTAATGAAGNAGSEFDGTYFYTTRWASNLIHKFDMSGNLVEEFSIPGVTGLRDLAFDGTYMYGGAASTTIYQMDFVSKTLIGTISSPVAVRYIAYDEGSDAFWCGNWDTPPTLVSRTGSTLGSITTGLSAQYGAAYDPDPAGPFLWIFDQGSGAGLPQIISQWDIASGTATGVTHDVMTDVGVGNTSAIAGGLFTTADFVSGKFSLGGLLQGVPDMFFVYELYDTGPPVGPGPATNPDPANGATDVDINATLSWDNPAGATSIEVFWGTSGNMTSVYSGSPITTFDPGTMDYMTGYTWRVNETDGSGTTTGTLWSYTTMLDPSIITAPFYPQTVDYWTGSTDQVTKTDVSEVRTLDPEMGWMTFDISGIEPGSQILSIEFWGYVNATYYPYWSVTPMGTCDPVSDDAATITAQLMSGYAQGTAYVYSNESSTFAPGWHNYMLETTAVPDLQAAVDAGQGWFAIGIVDRDFSTTYFINFDGWAETNMPYINIEYIPIPVELTSFTANAVNGNVQLNWSTATETNNKGFEVQRSSGGEYQTLAFIQGNGTSTQQHAYAYSDQNVANGNYSYRLRQVDFDGSSEFSQVVEVTVNRPVEYNLAQNYPNPFNPSTKINYGLKVDSKVTLKVFDILGQEVVTLLNENIAAGNHSVTFDASKLNSGVYLYKIEARGVDGSSFTSVKKMILTK